MQNQVWHKREGGDEAACTKDDQDQPGGLSEMKKRQKYSKFREINYEMKNMKFEKKIKGNKKTRQEKKML